MWRRPLCAGFRPMLLGQGAFHAHSQERQTEADRAQCSHWPATRAPLIIYSHSCLFTEWARTAFFIPTKRNKKSQHVLTGTEHGLSQNGQSKNWRWQTECCLHMRGKAVELRVAAPRTQGSPYTRRDGTDFRVIAGSVVERCEREGSVGFVTGHTNLKWHTFQTKKILFLPVTFRLAVQWGLWALRWNIQRWCQFKVNVILQRCWNMMMSRHTSWLECEAPHFAKVLLCWIFQLERRNFNRKTTLDSMWRWIKQSEDGERLWDYLIENNNFTCAHLKN